MKRALLAAGLLTAVALAGPSAAQAAPIRNCGDAGSNIHNVTTRNLTCSTARRAAKQAGFIQHGNYTFTHPTDDRYRCRVRIPDPRSWRVDVRCTYWFYVVRWQYDSGE